MAERNKSMTTRVKEAAPRFLDALRQRSFSTLFLIALFLIAFSPLLCVVSVFGGVGFFITAGVLAIQICSLLLFLMPLFLLVLVAFVGVFSITMAIMVTIKCINAVIQRFIRAYLCLRNTLMEYIYQVQAWYKRTCRLVFDMYLNILRIIFFPFVVAEYIRQLVINTVYSLFINPVTWVVCLPSNMLNGVVEAIFIILGVQGSSRSRQSSRYGYSQDVQRPRPRHHQPMNGKQLHQSLACFDTSYHSISSFNCPLPSLIIENGNTKGSEFSLN